MDPALHAVAVDAEPRWPDSGGRPVLFLVDASSSLEKRLLAEWVTRNRPGDALHGTADLPPSRRRRPWAATPSSLRRVLDEADDPLLVPLRIAWRAPRRGPRGTIRLFDLLLSFGDPRDPGALRQWWTLRAHPEKVSVVQGAPAAVSELRSRWVDARSRIPDDPVGFEDYVALQAGLALERAERQLRGSRYKVPRFLREDLLTRPSFRLGLLRLSDAEGVTPDQMLARTSRYLREMAATHSTYVIDIVAALIRVLYTQGYSRRIVYDRDELQRLAELGQEHPLLFLPGHKSNLDHLVLTYVLHENGLPPSHTAGGINMNFFPVGILLRRAGVFFIRRSFRDNAPYKFTLKQYIDYLLSKRFNLEWFIEGGRSRSGKMREPRFGMLAYIADSFRRGSTDDAVIVPVSIAYDQIQDVRAYAAEQKGGAKERESFGWLIGAVRTMRRRYGTIHVRFGETIRLSEVLQPYATGADTDIDAGAIEIRKLAFEVATRINRATPITPISLVTLALLGHRDRALTVEETSETLGNFISFVERRGLPVTEEIGLDTPDRVHSALEALVGNRVVSRFDGGSEAVYSVEPEQHLAAAYYRNTIIHFFTTGAIAELALLRASEAPGHADAAFWDEVMALRDLLKFEFFFAEKDEYRAEVAAAVAFHRPGWEEAIGGSAEEITDIVRAFRPFGAHWVLRPFLEAYMVVADALEQFDFRQDVEPKRLIASCMSLGGQYRLQHRIRSPETVSTVLFQTATQVAENRGLLSGGGMDVLRAREGFAGEVRDVVRRVDAVEALAEARRVGPVA